MSETGINYELDSEIVSGVTKIASASLTELTGIKNKLDNEDCEIHFAPDNSSPKTETSLVKKKTAKKRDDSIKSAPAKALTSTSGKKSSIPTLKKVSPVSSKSTILRASRVSTIRSPTTTSRHTLEVQFINKKKRLLSLAKEIIEKQRPVITLYENLTQIKQKLNELGKVVELDDVKLISIEKDKQKEKEAPKTPGAAGECIPEDLVIGMKTSIEEIPRTLLGICQNLLSRRAVIVDLLESVTRAEVTVEDISDKIEALKSEGSELQKSLDLIINEHESKINELVSNWQTLLMDKAQESKPLAQIDELHDELEKQKEISEQSTKVIHELKQKLEDKKILHDKSLNEFDSVIRGLKEQIKKLETEADSERKTTIDQKTRNSVNLQTIKLLKTKISELEAKNKDYEERNADLMRKMKSLQDGQKVKEAAWAKEKEDLTKTVKQQEALLHKLTSDRNQFETRYKHAERRTDITQEKLQQEIESLKGKLEKAEINLQDVLEEKEKIEQKCSAIEEHMTRMGMDSKREMTEITNNINWGKNDPLPEGMEEKRIEIANKLFVAQLQDRIRVLEAERQERLEYNKVATTVELPSNIEIEAIRKNQDIIAKYQQLLEESEEKLREKSMEVAKLTSEIRHLKVRQDALEEQNVVCPTVELQTMVEEGRAKLNELMKKSLESEQKIADYEAIIEKQSKQMNEMENLLRYRDNVTEVLKKSRDELIMEKESLAKFSQELRSVLIEVTKEGKLKDRLIKELQEKCDDKEKQIAKLEKEVKDLETNLIATNEKRFKLQETICAMEKELQTTKAHVNQLADIQSRYESEPELNSSNLNDGALKIKINVMWRF